MHDLNVDDLRYVALLAQTGSMVETGRTLRVDRTTVLRRISAFENRLGVKLFHKVGSKYVILPEAAQILEAATGIEAAINVAKRKMTALTGGLDGALAVTTTDSIYLSKISQMISEFQNEHPTLNIRLSITTRKLKLEELESEVSIRPSDHPPEHLSAKRICDLGFGVYGSEAYVAQNRGSRIENHIWLCTDDRLANSGPGKWQAEHIPEDRIVLRADTFIALGEACRLGNGLALLPHCYAQNIPGLAQAKFSEVEMPQTGLWLLTHPDFEGLPRVHEFIQHMSKNISQNRLHFSGN